jgi:hypothetical protein
MRDPNAIISTEALAALKMQFFFTDHVLDKDKRELHRGDGPRQ